MPRGVAFCQREHFSSMIGSKLATVKMTPINRIFKGDGVSKRRNSTIFTYLLSSFEDGVFYLSKEFPLLEEEILSLNTRPRLKELPRKEKGTGVNAS